MERPADGKEIECLPVVVPGFSGRNLHALPLDQISCLWGEFFWRQFAEANRAWGGEHLRGHVRRVRSGERIFRCREPPAGELPRQPIGYESLPSDDYLRLMGGTRKLLQSRQPFPDKPPL